MSRAVKVLAFNPSTQEADGGGQISMSSRPAWSTEQVPEQPKVLCYTEKPSLKKPKREEKKKENVAKSYTLVLSKQ